MTKEDADKYAEKCLEDIVPADDYQQKFKDKLVEMLSSIALISYNQGYKDAIEELQLTKIMN